MNGINPGIIGQRSPLPKCYSVTYICNIYSTMTYVRTLKNIPTHPHFEKKIKKCPIIIHTHPILNACVFCFEKAMQRSEYPSILFVLRSAHKRSLRNQPTICFWIGIPGWIARKEPIIPSALQLLILVPIPHFLGI